jgi:RNA polymerase sigma-70 factor (ECF subfamily)
MSTQNDFESPDGEAQAYLQTRQSLIESLGNPDNPRWHEFFRIYWKFIYNMARRDGLNDSEAKEVVQETVIYVSHKMPGFKYDRSKGSFKGWLGKLVQWRIADQQRKREGHHQRFVPSDPDEPDPFLEIPDPSTPNPSALDEEWERSMFEAALQKVKERVKPKQYQMFDLYVIKQWPIKKITSALGVNFGQVYLAKHRLTGLIREELKKLQEQY